MEKKEKNKKHAEDIKDCVLLLSMFAAVICSSGVIESMMDNPTPLNIGIFAINTLYLVLFGIANWDHK